jgi:hypothetical protein
MDQEKRKKLIYAITKWAAILTGFLTLILMLCYSLGTIEEIRLVAILWVLSVGTAVTCGFLSLHVSDE